MLDRSHLIFSANDQFNDKFQILLGSYDAGNNSNELQNQLKQYIIQAMKLNMITRTAGHIWAKWIIFPIADYFCSSLQISFSVLICNFWAI